MLFRIYYLIYMSNTNKPKILYVYKITNTLNGKLYVGRHTYTTLTNSYYGSGIAIKKAIKKYGKEFFNKDILCICDTEDKLNEMEIFWIQKLGTYTDRNGYNMTKGGEGMSGYILSRESIERGINARKEHYKNHPETSLKLSEISKQKTGSKNSFYGKKLTESHIDKMRIARIKAITGKNNPSAVRIRCIELDKTFDTAKDAASYVGLKSSTTVLKCAKGHQKLAGGYTWEILN